MNKKQAAETLKKYQKERMKNHLLLGKVKPLTAAIDKAISVLSDKTEYVKRSTYRKLKETYEHQENCYVQLMCDASEYRMLINKLKGRNLLERILNKDLH
jgi:hypothetical protein